jgi:putative aminopeptidase FrvX
MSFIKQMKDKTSLEFKRIGEIDIQGTKNEYVKIHTFSCKDGQNLKINMER